MTFSRDVFFRLIAAALGGYLCAVLFSFALVPVLVAVLSSQLGDAVYAATMWSYVCFFIVFIMSFAVGSVKRLYAYLISFCFICHLMTHFSSIFSGV